MADIEPNGDHSSQGLAGYRDIGTALFFGNEKEVGQAIKELISEDKIKRKDLFEPTPVWSYVLESWNFPRIF